MLEKRLAELIPARKETIFEAVRYSLLSGGKRIRPQLVLATASTFGVDSAIALDPACALEMVHTYSLIHDDLPCMDNDDLRRGKPTLHKAYGEAIAVLTGDYLLTFAFEVLSQAPHLSPLQKLQMIQVLSHCSGAPGMIGGQVIDIESEHKAINEETLLNMHHGKTGALIRAAIQMGAIAASQPHDSPLLLSIAQELGLSFQLQDDLLDATSTTTTLGKKAGADAERAKATAISVYGIQGTQQKLQNLQHSLSKHLEQLPSHGGELKALIEKILHRNH